MLRFRKGPQPHALTALQATPGADWSGARSRDLWPSLLEDQGYLCAYCQRRIPTGGQDRMHVEHWHAQSSGDGGTRWRNLLGVCPGNPRLEVGEKTTDTFTHCDAKRGAVPLHLHPVEGEGPDPLVHLAYTVEGECCHRSGSPNVDLVEADIEHLGLNAARLKRGRREIYNVLVKKLLSKEFAITEIRELYRRFELERGRQAPEHSEVARHYLRRWARKKGKPLT